MQRLHAQSPDSHEVYTVKLGDKERFDMEQIGVKEKFPMTNCQFAS